MIKENLCYYDLRNPNHIIDLTEEGLVQPQIEGKDFAHKDCVCDNCFHGRTKLATEIIKLSEEKHPVIDKNCCLFKQKGLTKMNQGCAERNRCLIGLTELQDKMLEVINYQLVFGDNFEEKKKRAAENCTNLAIRFLMKQ